MESNIIQGQSQQMQWQRMRGANKGIEADYLTIGAKKIYLAVYYPKVWGADYEIYIFVDGAQAYKDIAADYLKGMEKLENWLNDYAARASVEAMVAEHHKKGGSNGQ